MQTERNAKGFAMVKRIYTFHWITTLLILCLSAAGFFYGSFNLFFLFEANLSFIAEHGADAVQEGAVVQLAELFTSMTIAALSYTSIKICERVLVDWVLKD